MAQMFLRVGLQAHEHAQIKKAVQRGVRPQQIINAFPLHDPELIMGAGRRHAEDLGIISRRRQPVRGRTEEEIRADILAETETNRAAQVIMEQASSDERKRALKLEQENEELKKQLAEKQEKPAAAKPAAKPIVKAKTKEA